MKKTFPNRTVIMGILNITPDSFSDGGMYYQTNSAVKRALEMVKEGADIIDIGGESTRPGSLPVSAQEEKNRVLPVIKGIRKKLGKNLLISIDTNKAEVAQAALDAGANMVNSLGGFTFEPALAKVVAKAHCPIILYHIKGEPRTMQSGKISYKDIIREIKTFFKEQINFGMKQGIKKESFILDPGIGFGKTVEHNLKLVKNFKSFTDFKLPTLIGVSRKSHLGKILQNKLKLKDLPLPSERIEAGLAEVAIAVLSGAKIIRTHDVYQTKKFLTVLDLLK